MVGRKGPVDGQGALFGEPGNDDQDDAGRPANEAAARASEAVNEVAECAPEALNEAARCAPEAANDAPDRVVPAPSPAPPGDGDGVQEKVLQTELVSQTCAWCGKEIRYSGRGRPRRTCSKTCRNRLSEANTFEDRVGRKAPDGLLRDGPIVQVVTQKVLREQIVMPTGARDWLYQLSALEQALDGMIADRDVPAAQSAIGYLRGLLQDARAAEPSAWGNRPERSDGD